MPEADFDLAFDCETSCYCEGELSLCPNVIAFGTATALEYAKAVQVLIRKASQEQEESAGNL